MKSLKDWIDERFVVARDFEGYPTFEDNVNAYIKELEQLSIKHELDVWKADWKEGYDYAMKIILGSLRSGTQ